MKDVKGLVNTQLPEGVRRLCRVLGALFAVIFGGLALFVVFAEGDREVLLSLAVLSLGMV